MPRKDGVGYSKTTRVKMEHLAIIMNMHVAITTAVINKHKDNWAKDKYLYVDAYAGPGKYQLKDKTFIEGSPIVFMNAISYYGTPFWAAFIDKDRKCLDDLNKNLSKFDISYEMGDNWVTFIDGKQEENIPKLFDSRDPGQLGLFLFDPNGIPKLEIIQHVAKMRPRMEILIYVSATSIKRNKKTAPKLTAYMDSVDKQEWFVRKSIAGDKHQFTFLMGTNAPKDLFKPAKNISFVKAKSKEGKEIINKLEKTAKEYQPLDQIGLPGFDS